MHGQNTKINMDDENKKDKQPAGWQPPHPTYPWWAYALIVAMLITIPAPDKLLQMSTFVIVVTNVIFTTICVAMTILFVKKYPDRKHRWINWWYAFALAIYLIWESISYCQMHGIMSH